MVGKNPAETLPIMPYALDPASYEDFR